MSVAELVPVIAGDMDVLAAHARSLDGVGAAVADIGARVHATWQDLGAVYRAPEADQLLAATAPVQAVSGAVGDDVQAAAAALADYAVEVRDIQTRLDVLRADAVALDTALAGPAASALTDQRNTLIARIAAAETDFDTAQHRCAARITALTNTPPAPGPSGFDRFLSSAAAVIGATGDALGALGTAALHHPQDVAGIIGGAILVDLSVTGFVASLAADTTVIGATVGVPAGAATLAGAATGLTILGAATTDLVNHALHDGRTAHVDTGGPAAVPAQPNPQAAAGPGATPGRIDESTRPFNPDERRLAEKLQAEGRDVKALPESTTGRSPDAVVDGVPTEFKSIQPTTSPADSSTVRNILRASKAKGGQARTIIIDGEQSTLTRSEAERGVRRFLGTGSRYYDSITIRTTEGSVTYP